MKKLSMMLVSMLFLAPIACEDSNSSDQGTIEITGRWMSEDVVNHMYYLFRVDDLDVTNVTHQTNFNNLTIHWGNIISYSNKDNTCIIHWTSMSSTGMGDLYAYQKMQWSIDTVSGDLTLSRYAANDDRDTAEQQTFSSDVVYQYIASL